MSNRKINALTKRVGAGFSVVTEPESSPGQPNRVVARGTLAGAAYTIACGSGPTQTENERRIVLVTERFVLMAERGGEPIGRSLGLGIDGPNLSLPGKAYSGELLLELANVNAKVDRCAQRLKLQRVQVKRDGSAAIMTVTLQGGDIARLPFAGFTFEVNLAHATLALQNRAYQTERGVVLGVAAEVPGASVELAIRESFAGYLGMRA
jgi:hypothetical protein